MSRAEVPDVETSEPEAWDKGRSLIGRQRSGRRMTPQSPHEALQPDAPPPPPPKVPSKRRPTLSALSGFLSFLVIAAIGALAGMAYFASRLQEPGPLQADKVVFIAQHTELPDIIEKLDSEGVIDSPFTLNAVLAIERKRTKVKFGEYLFKAKASLRSVVDTLVSGKQLTHPITIPEGLTSAQVVQRLRDNDLLVGDIRALPNEGVLLPETYKVARGMTRVDLLNKMETDSRRAIEQIWARRSPDLPLQSPYELVTLASIVEKETGKADERPRVAGVFINRLKRRMRLQSDPTIVYGLVAGQGTLGHSITRSELDKKTPYNTYQIDGLPPGPIDNPGRAALEAVANPSRTQDLYFVADGTGGHAFAGTIEDHNRNVQRWRQIQREAKDKVDVDKLAPGAVAPSAHGNQRSDDSDGSVFGVLPRSVGTVSIGAVAAFADPEQKPRHRQGRGRRGSRRSGLAPKRQRQRSRGPGQCRRNGDESRSARLFDPGCPTVGVRHARRACGIRSGCAACRVAQSCRHVQAGRCSCLCAASARHDIAQVLPPGREGGAGCHTWR